MRQFTSELLSKIDRDRHEPLHSYINFNTSPHCSFKQFVFFFSMKIFLVVEAFVVMCTHYVQYLHALYTGILIVYSVAKMG